MLPMAVAQSFSDRMTKSQGEAAILGVVRAIQKHWQSSLSRRCRVGCKRDNNSIANNVMQQKGSFSMPGKRK